MPAVATCYCFHTALGTQNVAKTGTTSHWNGFTEAFYSVIPSFSKPPEATCCLETVSHPNGGPSRNPLLLLLSLNSTLRHGNSLLQGSPYPRHCPGHGTVQQSSQPSCGRRHCSQSPISRQVTEAQKGSGASSKVTWLRPAEPGPETSTQIRSTPSGPQGQPVLPGCL